MKVDVAVLAWGLGGGGDGGTISNAASSPPE